MKFYESLKDNQLLEAHIVDFLDDHHTGPKSDSSSSLALSSDIDSELADIKRMNKEARQTDSFQVGKEGSEVEVEDTFYEREEVAVAKQAEH